MSKLLTGGGVWGGEIKNNYVVNCITVRSCSRSNLLIG